MDWRLDGEFLISCNCDVFCPCVLSLGKSEPTYGACHSWFGFHVADGEGGGTALDGLNVVMLLETPGPLEQGNWTTALYIDERASDEQAEALERIFSGRAGGEPGWWSIMVANALGTKRAPIEFSEQGRGWRMAIPKVLDGNIEPIAAADEDGVVQITGSRYWMTPDVTVASGTRSRFRDFGRNWDLSGRSAEHGRFSWSAA